MSKENPSGYPVYSRAGNGVLSLPHGQQGGCPSWQAVPDPMSLPWPLLSCQIRTLQRSPRLSMSEKLNSSIWFLSNLLDLLDSFRARIPLSPFSPNRTKNTLASVPAPGRQSKAHRHKLSCLQMCGKGGIKGSLELAAVNLGFLWAQPENFSESLQHPKRRTCHGI